MGPGQVGRVKIKQTKHVVARQHIYRTDHFTPFLKKLTNKDHLQTQSEALLATVNKMGKAPIKCEKYWSVGNRLVSSPFSTAYPGQGHGDLRGEAHTLLSPASSTSFPDQSRDLSSVSWVWPGVPPRWTCLKHRSREATNRYPVHMAKPAHLAPLSEEEQWLYSSLPDVWWVRWVPVMSVWSCSSVITHGS